ncbi:NosD domain-containing protein [Haladaptatus salinisoli]|uniref:NosD domain-containing protein n=1 Tax=Haladaptatus salinisoli TaxID=2884876 RepID=UPI001D0B474D|nr:NosD domain-containing protein [Haladaptatus salinisoli]
MKPSAVLAVGLALVCVLGGVTAAVGPQSGAPTSAVDSCTTISKSGHYVLGSDVHNGKTRISTGCVVIRADDVVLDGRGHTLDGFGVSDTSGILVENASDVTVRNVRVKDWNRGVAVRNASDVTIRGVKATNNAIGIDVENSNARLVGNTVTGDLHGVALADPWDDELRNNVIHRNHGVDVHAPLTVVDVFGVRLTLGPPLDPDRDGRYEDLTGNGETGVWDAVAFPVVVVTDAVGIGEVPTEQRNALDFDGDGGLDHGDVLAYAGLRSVV